MPAPAAPGARLRGLGSYQPGVVVTNDDLARRLDTSDDWIRTRVGIRSRRIATADDTVVSMGAEAGSKALAAAGLAPSELDAVVVATSTLARPMPNAAAPIAERMGAGPVAAFDVNAACAGFCHGLAVASDMVRAGTARHVAVIGSEKSSPWLDEQDRSTSIIFADGAGAAVLGPAPSPAEVGVGPVAWGSEGALAGAISIDEQNHLRQEGRTVFRWATTRITPVALRAVERAGIAVSDVDVLVTHQANLRIVDAIARGLRVAGARADLVVADDIVHSGNTLAASIPLALDHMRSAGRVRSGDIAVLVGFGSGLSYSAQTVRLP